MESRTACEPRSPSDAPNSFPNGKANACPTHGSNLEIPTTILRAEAAEEFLKTSRPVSLLFSNYIFMPRRVIV